MPIHYTTFQTFSTSLEIPSISRCLTWQAVSTKLKHTLKTEEKPHLVSSTESSEDPDDSSGMSQSHSPPRRKVNPARSNGHIATRTHKQVLVIRNKVSGTSGLSPPSTKPTTAKKETTVDRKPSVIRGRPIVTRSAIFKPTKSKTITTILPEEGKQTAKRREILPKSSSTMSKVSSDESYTPPFGQIGPCLNESCIAKRLTNSHESSSECEQSSSDDNSEDSDPPVYRKSHSVLPSLELRTGGAADGAPPECAPPCVQAPNPWFPSFQEPYVDVFLDGACRYNGRGEPRTGIGVWFGPDDPLNVSRPARGRQTNNAAEIEAAVEAAQRGQDAGIKKLRINTYSKYLVRSATEWIPTWEKNEWKTAENKPAKNRNEFAREAIERRALFSSGYEEDADNPSGPLKTIVDVPPLPIDSDENSSDEEFDMGTLKRDLQKSYSQFEKSMERKGLDISNINPDSLYWDHESMDTKNVPVSTHVSEGEEDEEILENLKALDPCGEFDDDTFPKRVQDFLEQYEERMFGSSAKKDQAEEALSNPLQCLKEVSETNGK